MNVQSETIGELAKSICNMQKTALFAITDSENPFLHSKYASLSSVWSAIRAPLTDNGLSIVQMAKMYSESDAPIDRLTIVTTLMHTSGEFITGEMTMMIPPDKKGQITPQGVGSVMTYLRRYALSAAVGICPIDDDAESVMSREEPIANKQTKKKSDIKKTDVPKLDDEPTLVNYTLPGEDSQAMKDLKEYKPVTTILNKEKTHFKVGKFEVLISEDGKRVWSDVPKFGDNDFDMDACVPCLVSALVRAHGVAFTGGKYGVEFGKEDK